MKRKRNNERKKRDAKRWAKTKILIKIKLKVKGEKISLAICFCLDRGQFGRFGFACLCARWTFRGVWEILVGAAQKTKQAGEEEEIDLEVEVSFRGGGGSAGFARHVMIQQIFSSTRGPSRFSPKRFFNKIIFI